MTAYLLLPSVFVGPTTWGPVAGRLADAGESVAVAETGGCTTPEATLDAYVAAASSGVGGLVVVPHSNAGYYAAAVAERLGAAGVVYVDAALPHGPGPAPLAAPGLLNLLAGRAGPDGLLPPWTRWWADSGELFPDDATRVRVEAAEPRLPRSYLESTVDVPAGWASVPSGYLGFGDTYADEQERAAALGWPVRRLDGGHLHLLHDPAACAAAIGELAVTLTGR